MAFMIGFPAIILAFTVYMLWEERKTRNPEYFDTVMAGGFIAGLSIPVGLLLSVIIGAIAGGAGPVVTDRYTLDMLNDTKELNGSFFLASGTIDEDLMFYYYQNNGEYSTLESDHADRVRIVESPGEPRLEITHNAKELNWFTAYDSNFPVKTFYIPEGSITNDYRLGDLDD